MTTTITDNAYDVINLHFEHIIFREASSEARLLTPELWSKALNQILRPCVFNSGCWQLVNKISVVSKSMLMTISSCSLSFHLCCWCIKHTIMSKYGGSMIATKDEVRSTANNWLAERKCNWGSTLRLRAKNVTRASYFSSLRSTMNMNYF